MILHKTIWLLWMLLAGRIYTDLKYKRIRKPTNLHKHWVLLRVFCILLFFFNITEFFYELWEMIIQRQNNSEKKKIKSTNFPMFTVYVRHSEAIIPIDWVTKVNEGNKTVSLGGGGGGTFYSWYNTSRLVKGDFMWIVYEANCFWHVNCSGRNDLLKKWNCSDKIQERGCAE